MRPLSSARRWIVLGLLVTTPLGCGQRKSTNGVGPPAPTTTPQIVPVPTFPAPDAPPGYLTAAPVGLAMPSEPNVKAYPLPQDFEFQKKRETERVARNRADIVDVFEKMGKTKEPWSPLARGALELVARYEAVDLGKRDDLEEQRADALKAALDAGCEDPLVRYYAWYEKRRTQSHNSQSIKEIDRIADQFDRQAYPIRHRLDATWAVCLTRAEAVPFPAVPIPAPPTNRRVLVRKRKDVSASFEAVWPAYAEAAKGHDVELDRTLAKIADAVIDGYDESGLDRKAGYERVERVLIDGDASVWLRKQVEGKFLVEYAWDARTELYANKVPEGAWAVFHERLKLAHAALNEAWNEDPSRPESATNMLTVAMGFGFSREQMEGWFQRALEADPGNFEACVRKLFLLQPKWGGSYDEMLAFGRQCARTKNWDARLPLILLHAHAVDLIRYKNVNFQSPSIWADVRDMLEPRLVQHPADRFALTLYGMIACRAEKYDLAHFLFTKLDRKPILDPLTYASVEQFVPDAWRARKAYAESISPTGPKPAK